VNCRQSRSNEQPDGEWTVGFIKSKVVLAVRGLPPVQGTEGGKRMDYDQDNVDEMVLALLYLTMFSEAGGTRAWKGHDWEALGRLHARGYISDPKSKAKSVGMTEEGSKRARELFEWHFVRKS
jgi:hypothetical protein